MARAELTDHGADGSFVIQVRMRVNLPSRALATGETSEGIRAEEPVTLKFRADWPQKAPSIGLRSTFPKHFAHTNRHKDGDLVPPCIVEAGNNDELLHARGLDGMVDQLALWLGRAAAGQLANYGDGWEPMHRERLDGSIGFDAATFVAELPTDGAVQATAGTYLASRDLVFISRAVADVGKTYSQQTLRREYRSGDTQIFAARAAFKDGKPPIFDQYQPDNVTTLDSLAQQAQSVGIDSAALRSAVGNYFTESVQGCGADPAAAWPLGFSVGIVLAVERPSPLIGTDKQTTELLTYLVRLDAAALSEGLTDETPVKGACHAQPPDPMILAKMSGYAGAELNQKITMLGCGSLGSKVAAHLGRAGFGRQTLIDKGYIWPHNAARHALFRTSGDKAEELKEALQAIGHTEVRAVKTDVTKVLVSPTDLALNIPAETQLIVDATASMAVFDALVTCNALCEIEGRVVRTALYGEGRVAVLMLEGPKRTIRLDDLNGTLFRRAMQDSALRRSLSATGAGLAPVFVGQNCRSMTMQMPDSRLSRGAALVSAQLEKWLTAGQPAAGVVGVGIEDANGIGATWELFNVRPTVQLNSDPWNVRILAVVAEEIAADAQHWTPLETGGGLLGSICHESRTIIVAGLLTAPSDSKRRKTEFILGTMGLVDQVRSTSDASLGYMNFIGTWHSHPMGGHHSSIDLRTLVGLALQARGAPSVSLVWSPEGLHAQVVAAGK